jgi:hypothetical protein
VGGLALGFNTPQMNRYFSYGTVTDNQIRALEHAGYFSSPITNLHTLRTLAHATNATVSLEYRVRSYLAANCRQCHQPGGSALGFWDARIEIPLSLGNIVDGALQNDLGDSHNRVVVPNDPAHSVLLTRIAQNGALRMPPLASNLLDTNSANLVSAWISSLTNYQTFSQWQTANFGSTNAPLTGAGEDFDGDGLFNLAEYLLGTDPKSAADNWKIGISTETNTIRIQYQQKANRGFEVQFTDSLSLPAVWRPLNVPANRPFISASDFQATVPDTTTNDSRFYRVRLFEP